MLLAVLELRAFGLASLAWRTSACKVTTAALCFRVVGELRIFFWLTDILLLGRNFDCGSRSTKANSLLSAPKTSARRRWLELQVFRASLCPALCALCSCGTDSKADQSCCVSRQCHDGRRVGPLVRISIAVTQYGQQRSLRSTPVSVLSSLNGMLSTLAWLCLLDGSSIVKCDRLFFL